MERNVKFCCNFKLTNSALNFHKFGHIADEKAMVLLASVTAEMFLAFK